MNQMNSSKPKKQKAVGRKAMLIIGIVILNISIFMAAFVFSFNMIINPIEKRDTEVQTLSDENIRLKSDTQLLKDQLEVVQSELDNYKKKSGSSATSKPSSTNSPTSTKSPSGTSSGNRSDDDTRDSGINMDND